MQTLGTELDRTIAGWGPEAAAALKRSRNKDRFRAAVERTWRLRPDVGRFVLMHTNGIYIAKDERPRKGPDRHKDWWVFGMYLDDAMARTEVDAWQSVLLMNLEQEGFAVNELRFFPAKWDMRQRRLFPELWEEGESACVPGNRDGLKYQDEARALDIVKRAVFLVFEDTELAWALLEKVRGASVREMFAADQPARRQFGMASDRGRSAIGCFFTWMTWRRQSRSWRRTPRPFGRAPACWACASVPFGCGRLRRCWPASTRLSVRERRSRCATRRCGAVQPNSFKATVSSRTIFSSRPFGSA